MRLLRKLTLLTSAWWLVGVMSDLEAETRHVVQPGQTLYRISKKYGVTVEAILAANPGIAETSVPTGMTLIIPDATDVPIVDFPLTLDEEQRQQQATATPARPQGEGSWMPTPESHWSDGQLNLAVILPFNLNGTSAEDNKTQMRSVEFYEGVLMAVDEMQERGRRLRVQAYDLGSQPIYNILSEPELQRADIVIAPIEENDVRQVATWSDMSGTPVVSPFGFSNSLLDMHQHLFQVNTAKSMLYQQLTDELMTRFADYTVVFVTDQMGGAHDDPYPAHLRQALARSNRPYKQMSYQAPELLMACDSILGLKDDNVLFVPVTPQAEAMRRMFSGLQHVKILRDARYSQAQAEAEAQGLVYEGMQPQMAVLGYPEWMRDTQDFVSYYYDLNVYMFSKFYANPFDPELERFYTTFKRWYGKEPMSLTPKYAMLGYDVANAFLKSLSRNGQNLEQRIADEDVCEGLQTPLHFEQSSIKGFYNRAFYLVHFTTDRKVEKIVVQ